MLYLSKLRLTQICILLTRVTCKVVPDACTIGELQGSGMLAKKNYLERYIEKHNEGPGEKNTAINNFVKSCAGCVSGRDGDLSVVLALVCSLLLVLLVLCTVSIHKNIWRNPRPIHSHTHLYVQQCFTHVTHTYTSYPCLH